MLSWRRDPPPRPRTAGRAGALAITILWVASRAVWSADAAASAALEHQVKAAFVYNFAKFVEWPASAFAAPDAPLTVCALAGAPFTRQLARAVQGKRVGHRGLVLRSLADGESPEGCHVLVIERDETGRVASLLAKSRPRPVLTVGEQRDFTQLGGVVSFTRQGEKIRFQINVDAASRAGLAISSKLLSVAQVVHETPPPEDRK